MKRPLLGIVAAFFLGILTEQLLDIPVFYILAYAIIFLLLSLLFIKSRKLFLLFAAIGFLFIGALAFKSYNSIPKDHIKNIIPVTQDCHKQVLLQGEILNQPDERITYYKEKESRFLLGVKALRDNNGWKPVRGILSVNVFNPRVNFKYGDMVILEGELSSPRPATNPGQFDYKKFLERKKIFYILKVREENFSKVTGHSGINIIKLLALRASQRIEGLIDKFTPEPEGSVLKAILLGKRQDIGEDLNEDFVKTGTVHVLVISGLHIGLLVSIFLLLFKLFRLPFRVWVFILVPVVIFYCIMVDSRPPVERATIMTLVFLFGRILRREQDLLNTLAFCALVILFLNPNDILDVGFQLSFLTVGSIIYFTPKLEKMFLKNELTRFHLLRALLVSFSAWLGSAPLIARYFNIFSPITVIANLFIVPWMFFVLASSVIFIISGFISSSLGLVFSQSAHFSVLILIKMASIFANIPLSYVRVKSPPWIYIIGFYIFLLFFFNRRLFKVKAKYFLIAALVILNFFIWRGAFFENEKTLRISFLDVGKGNAAFLEFPKGGTMLIDGGEGLGTNIGGLTLSRFLGSKGINNIDLVMATHPHTDHIGGIVTVLKNFKVRFFIDNGDSEANPLYAKCQDLIKQKRIKRFVVKEGDSIEGFEKVELLVLNPPARKFDDLNNDSLVLKLTSGDFSVLFSADIKEDGAKNLLLSQYKQMPSTVLKVPHHGGALGDAAFEFIKTINPKAAVISLGGREVNGDLLSILSRLQTRIYRTDTDGAIFLKSEKDEYSISFASGELK